MKTVVQKGDIIYVDRVLYKHYGVYNNDKSVIHFSPPSGVEINPETAYIRETSLEEFLKGGTLQIDHSIKPGFPPEEIARRARCLVGTNLKKYNLLSNNCEHFARWCATGNLESKQVNQGVAIATGVAATAIVGLFLKSLLDRDDSGRT